MTDITVIKQNLDGQETWRYSGRVIRKSSHLIVLEAFFNRPDMPFHGMVFAEGDRFIEAYFDNRWYNIFQLHDREHGTLKGWYCNVTRPAQFYPDRIDYVDLALDLLVFPDGRQLVLDEDEFESLGLDDDTRHHALGALQELQKIIDPQAGFSIDKIQ
jgi:uncharacterized protein